MLEVVQHEQQVAIAHRRDHRVEQRQLTRIAHAERLPDRLQYPVGLRDGHQIDENEVESLLIAQRVGNLQGQARLPHARRPCEGQQAHTLASEQPDNRSLLMLAAKERRQRPGEAIGWHRHTGLLARRRRN